jgi:hypothetical protein
MPHVTGHPAGSPCWFDLMTPDVEAASRFYAALFGWTVEEQGPEFGHYRMAYKDGKAAAGLGPLPADAPFPTAWSVYLASANLDADLARVSELGGQVAVGPMDVGQEGRMAMIADPGGAMFGLWQAGNHVGATIVNEPGGMCWSEVNTRHGEPVRAFYQGLTGMSAVPMEGMPGYHTLQRGPGEAQFGVLDMDANWEGLPSHWMPYFAVADLDVALALVQEHGGKMQVPPFDTPYGRMSVIADPAGAYLTLMKLTE